jgi:membrane complex biogenesis BtpA family protein
LVGVHLILPKYPLDLNKKPLIGMIHLPSLLKENNTPISVDDTSEICFRDAITLEKAGFDAILIENFHDSPYSKYKLDDTRFLIMNLLINRIFSKLKLPCGINILRNACVQAIIMATVNQASFIRCNIYEGAYVTDQGIIEGVATEVQQKRKELQSKVKILADVHVKHASPIGGFSLIEAARNALFREAADAIIVSGKETGKLIDLSVLENFVEKSNIKPILGSGLTDTNLNDIFPYISGAIVGSSIKTDRMNLSSSIDLEKARILASMWKREREKDPNRNKKE